MLTNPYYQPVAIARNGELTYNDFTLILVEEKNSEYIFKITPLDANSLNGATKMQSFNFIVKADEKENILSVNGKTFRLIVKAGQLTVFEIKPTNR